MDGLIFNWALRGPSLFRGENLMNREEIFAQDNSGKTILSLFDYTGAWSQPYVDAGYNVIRIDYQIEGIDIHDFCVEKIAEELDLPPFVHGILAAVPCTEFAVSGARWFKQKDADGRTEKALDLLEKTMATVEYYTVTDQDVIDDGYPGLQWWVIENPVSRINSLAPHMKQYGPTYFQPHNFGHAYTKKTGLWGEFNSDMEKFEVDPVMGSIMHNVAPGPNRQNIRSATPEGFAWAFFDANP